MPLVESEPTISAGVRPQTRALDRAATGTGVNKSSELKCPLLNPTWSWIKL